MNKNSLAILMIVGLLTACTQPNLQSEVDKPPPVIEPQKPIVIENYNSNCVTKDRNGNCPPLPNSPRPSPKN